MAPCSCRRSALAGIRVQEIGCGPGTAAREVARRIGTGHVHAIDRSPRAIAQAVAGSEPGLASGLLAFQQVASEDFTLPEGRPALRPRLRRTDGALDGRHPEAGRRALGRITAALTPTGQLLVADGTSIVDVRVLTRTR